MERKYKELELQKMMQDTFQIEQVLKRQEDNSLVKWMS